MQVYLIRHTTVALSEPTCYGQTDIDVAPTFLQEAARTKERLAGITFDKVYCSPLRRAAMLAAYCGYPLAERDDRLKEMWMGQLEMVPFRKIPQKEIDAWFDNFMQIEMPGGESSKDLYRRIESFFTELKTKPYQRVAVFYHGCAILCTRIWNEQLPQTSGFNDITDFGGVNVIEI